MGIRVLLGRWGLASFVASLMTTLMATLGLRLAALEIFPQRRGKAPLLVRFLRRIRTIDHGSRLFRATGFSLRRPGPYGKDRGGCGAAPKLSRNTCCRSSVVEHPLGKGEVVSSILPGSTTINRDSIPGPWLLQRSSRKP